MMKQKPNPMVADILETLTHFSKDISGIADEVIKRQHHPERVLDEAIKRIEDDLMELKAIKRNQIQL